MSGWSRNSSCFRAAITSAAISVPLSVPAQDADEQPYQYPADTFISISGTIDEVRDDAFVLAFGGGEISVEMDEEGRDGGGSMLKQGDDVRVYGIVDDALFERKTIEAGGVYVERLGRTFYASSEDEEDDRHLGIFELSESSDPYDVVLRGRVVGVDDSEQEIRLAAGAGRLTVEYDAAALVTLPEPETLEVGDLILISGRIDEGFLDGRDIVAEVVQQVAPSPP